MTDFKLGDLVFAKMRGFPHWPAQIAKIPSNDDSKYSVYFFGTRETAFVKATDLLDYQTNIATHGIANKRGGLQKALDEIHEVANKKGLAQVSPKKDDLSAFSPPGKRQRIPNRLYNDDDFVVPQSRRKHHISEHKVEQSSPEDMKGLGLNVSGGSLRRRTDSTSSTERSRKRLFSERSGVDLSDIEPTLNTQKILSNGGMSLFGGIDSGHSDDDAFQLFGSTRSRHRTKSRLLDEYLGVNNFIKSPRDRSGSLSSTNGRTRLISNISISDNFDDLAKIFNPNELFIEDYSSEESDRPIIPDDAANQASINDKFCYHCKSSCEIWKRKWRCTNKECNRWNGILERSNSSKKPHPLSNTYSNTWDRTYLSDLPVSDSSINNDPIGCLPTEQLATFSSERPQFSLSNVSDLPATASGDEAVLKIKEYLLNDHEQRDQEKSKNEANKQSQQDQQSVRYGFVSQDYSNKQDAESHNTSDNYAMKQQVYEDLASPPPAVRFEQYAPINKRIVKTSTRSKSKVENTPPADANGNRQCIQCPGHVRPQMCGGNKHRWRCVDKRCRKWYGWVKSDDIIPPDLGKKGRWRDLVIRVQSSHNEFEDRRACDMMMQNSVNPDSISLYENSEEARNRRKYKRKSIASRNVSPLSGKEKYFGPSSMEIKPRWWIVNNERRRADVSPERNFGCDLLDAASTFRLMGNSMLTAATTRNDECGSVNGALDLMMDSLLASMAPMFTMTKYIPGLELPEGTIQRIWEKTTLHTPLL